MFQIIPFLAKFAMILFYFLYQAAVWIALVIRVKNAHRKSIGLPGYKQIIKAKITGKTLESDAVILAKISAEEEV